MTRTDAFLTNVLKKNLMVDVEQMLSSNEFPIIAAVAIVYCHKKLPN